MAADDNECTTIANLLHFCATMLPVLVKYVRDDPCSEIVHRTSSLSLGKFSAYCIGRKHRCGKFSADRTDSQETHWLCTLCYFASECRGSDGMQIPICLLAIRCGVLLHHYCSTALSANSLVLSTLRHLANLMRVQDFGLLTVFH